MQYYLCEDEDEPEVRRPSPPGLARVVAGPGFRSCSHSGCTLPAECTLAHNYAERRAWLLELETTPDPHTYDLCAYHGDRFRPPRGWEADDLRPGAGRLV